MPRLFDLMMESAAHAPLLAAPPDDHMPVVVADAVSEFFFAGTTREDWDFARDLTDCTPRFPAVFIEVGRPSRVVSDVHGVNDAAHLPPRWGWRFESKGRDRLAETLRDARRGPAFEQHYQSYVDDLAGSGLVDVARAERALNAPDPSAAGRRLEAADCSYFAAAAIRRALDDLKTGANHGGRGGLGWLLRGALILERDGRAVGPVATLDLILDRAGRPSPPPLIDAFGGAGLTAAETAVLRATMMPLVFPALLSLSFLNRAGVTLRAVEPPGDPARRPDRQDQATPDRYLVLDVGAVAAVDRN